MSSDFRDRVVEACAKSLDIGLTARAERFKEIKKNEDMYLGHNPPALKGRSNIPFDSVVMGGFIDTLLAEVYSPINIEFGAERDQDKISADKMDKVFEKESAPDRGNYDEAVQGARFLAGLSGRGTLKFVVGNVPKFHADVECVDHYDMVYEAQGGGNIDKHNYKHQINIFRDKNYIKKHAGTFYDKKQVALLFTRMQSANKKEVYDKYQDKMDRLKAFGIEPDITSFTGDELFNFVETVIKIDGEYYYVFWEIFSKTWIRLEKLVDVFDHAKKYPGRGAWASFATHPHPFMVYSKAPADDVRPIAYTMKKVVNYAIDNLEKRNWQQRAYDPKVFRDAKKLFWRQNGLVPAKVSAGKSIESGIFEFSTPDTTNISINVIDYLNGFLGQKTGITADAQGKSNEKRVGILVSNLQQVSKRLNLQNQTFKQALNNIGVMFKYGVYEYLREDYAVKLIGNDGISYEETITRRDTEKDFTISVSDGAEEEARTAIDVERKTVGFEALENHEAIMQKVNPEWYLEERLKFMGYGPQDIRYALDVNSGGDEKVLAKAAQAIEDCIKGKELYLIHQDATPAFIQKILTYVDENFPLIPAVQLAKISRREREKYQKDQEVADKLVRYANAHIEIARKNMTRKAVSVLASRGAVLPEGQEEAPVQQDPTQPPRLAPRAPRAPQGPPAQPDQTTLSAV